MIIFLYGPDQLALGREAENIVKKYKEKHSSGVNYFSFDLSANSIKEVENAVKTTSFFDEIKLVSVRYSFIKKDSPELIELIKNFNILEDKKIVLMVKEGLDERDLVLQNKKLFVLLSDKKNLVRGFELKEKKVEPNIFNLLDAVANGNRSKALELLYVELKTGRDPNYLLSMLAYQFRNMLTIKDLTERKLSSTEIAKMTKIHPFVISKLRNNLGINIEEIKKKFNYLAQVDLLSKQGKVDIEDCLYNIIFSA